MADQYNPIPKRVVLKHLTGRFQILGTIDQLQQHLETTDLPVQLDNVAIGNHIGSCTLSKIAPRFILYCEILIKREEPHVEPIV